MENGDSMTDHLNSCNALVSQLVSIYVNMEEQNKCITLSCYLPKSWYNLVVTINNTTQSTLKFEDVVASL